MLNPFEAPEGFTYSGMPRGWMIRKKTPGIRKLEQENEELKTTLSAIMERLEKLEEQNR